MGESGLNFYGEAKNLFRGITFINLDEKGRMAMPARYRSKLPKLEANQWITTIDTKSTCLLLYPLAEWEIIEQKLAALPNFDSVARRAQRLLIGHATEVELDGQGRVLLPTPLREYAQLDKRIVLLGQGKRFELWDEALWKQNCQYWLEEEMNSTQQLPAEVQNLCL